jgi:hypothetical protein
VNLPAPIPPTVARQFMADLQAYYAEDDAVKRDEIAGRQLAAIRQYQRPRQKKFSLADVKRLFEMMKDGVRGRYRLAFFEELIVRLLTATNVPKSAGKKEGRPLGAPFSLLFKGFGCRTGCTRVRSTLVQDRGSQNCPETGAYTVLRSATAWYTKSTTMAPITATPME